MLYVVIPVYNRWHYTQACLEALRKQTFRAFQTVVVDDGSTDGTAGHLADAFPEVTVLKGSGNLYWTAAVNLGIAHALAQRADRVMTLNNDTLPPPDFLARMHGQSLVHPNALMGPLELDAGTGKVLYGGERINWLKATAEPLPGTAATGQGGGLHPVDWLPGRGLLIPAAVFATSGGFNARTFPHYFADLDFTRTALRHGFPLYLNYEAKLLTYPEASGDRQNKARKSLRNYYNHLFGIKGGGNLCDFTRFARRHCPWPYLPSYVLLGSLRRIGSYFLRKKEGG
jgi:GT2 family glycosyltransferase